MSSYCEEIDFAEYHYYKINRILLSTFKLWPYGRSRFAIINHIINFTLLVSLIVFQLTSFLTYRFTLNFFILVLSYAVPCVISIVLYCSFYNRPNDVRRIWKDLRDNWNILKNEAEREIMRKHSLSGQLISTLALVGVVVCFGLYAALQLVPDTLNLIFPLNETRSHYRYAVTEYFVDKEKYFYLLLCHWLIGALVNFLIDTAVLSLLLVYVEHVCGLLSIASYRIEHSVDQYKSRILTEKQNRVISRNIGVAVEIHRKALRCSSFLEDTFAPYLFITAIFTVITLSFNFFRVLKAMNMHEGLDEILSPVLCICMCIAAMLVPSYYGQKITDHNNEIFYSAYKSKWYEIPIKNQKLFLFIMDNTTKEYFLNVGIIIEASIKGFAKLISTSVSYFTVIYSLQLSEV